MADKPFILVCDGMDEEVFEKLRNINQLEVYPEANNSQDTIKELLPRAHGLIIRSATNMNKELLDLGKNLKYIIRAGEGTDNIDKNYCQEKNIKVSNTPGANNNSAAEHALALMMTILRKTAWANNKMQNGGWDKSLFTGYELTNKKIGIIGFGRIGQLLCKRLQGFEPQVMFYDPFVKNSPFDYAKKYDDIREIFKQADIISIHMPLLEQTKGMINKELLDLMPSHAVLVNAARGNIVNEDDLVNVLKAKKIQGAGFDVFASEPLPKDSPLRGLDNLVLTPHLGGSTEEAQLRVGEMAFHQMTEFFLNNNLLNEVNA